MFLVPETTNASIFSTIFGPKVSAETTGGQGTDMTSQNMDILENSLSPIQILAYANGSKSPADPVSSSTSNNIVDNNALVPNNPQDQTSATQDQTFSPGQISVYVVRNGDTLSQIADMYDVSTNTILWANDMKKGATIKPGDVLLILPVNGIEYTVKKGDTLQSIAKKYKADVQDILQYNSLADSAKLSVGNQLIIPNGQMMDEGGGTPAKNLNQSLAQDIKYYQSHSSLPNLSGYYVNPVPGYVLTQGLHANNGVDLAAPTGTPIYAAAAGRVSFSRTGWNGGFGNLVIIDHPNGTQTLYAHQSRIVARWGEEVSQGQIIGYIGSTGHSTGPHLHFEVHGARNPGVDASWKK